MRVTAKYVLWLLPLLLFGCGHKQVSTPLQPLAPPIEDKPLPKAENVPKADLPPPVIGDPQPPAKPAITPAPAPEPPKKPVHRVKKPPAPPTTPATTPASAPTTTPVQVASNPAPAPAPASAPSVSAIGQLSSGSSGGVRSETEDSINSTEKAVNGITRSLSDTEQKTAAQIREFVKQAKEALSSGDIDGAKTLVMKAKVLLTELKQ